MSDGTYCDCVTDDYAVEFDWGKKWAEALGQSLHYARLTGKKGGIVLILLSPKERRFLERLQADIDYYDLPVTVWTMNAGQLNLGCR